MPSLELQERPPEAEQAPYRPYGGALKAWKDYDSRVILLEGPAGTGKSRLWFERIHYWLERVPGARALYCRVTRESCTDSGLVTFEEHVLPRGHYLQRGAGRGNRHSYRYANGSELVIGGLDKPTRLYSTEYDLVFVQEATEASEAQVAPFLRALRNNKLPFQQIVLDCNPTYEEHWLYEWEEQGKLTCYQSRHEDNPSVSPEYLAGLAILRGADRDSLLLGLRTGMVEGSYYGPLLKLAKDAGRIYDGVYDPNLAVHVAVDHGIDDYTSLWFYQCSPHGQWRFVDYFEWSGEPSSYYCGIIDDRRAAGGWHLGKICLPHDSESRADAGDRITRRVDTYKSHFGSDRVRVVPRVKDQADNINLCRNNIPQSLFDRTACKAGLGRLKGYRRDQNIRTGLFGVPVHDLSSHAADALAYAYAGYQPPSSSKPAPQWNRKRETKKW